MVLMNWSKSALMCYKRSCRCKGCYYEHYFTEGKCKMKQAVKDLIVKFGKPTDADFKRFGEDE